VSAVAFIQAEKANYPIGLLCKVAEISRSRYYQAIKEPMSAREARDAELRPKIRSIFDAGRGNYGSPRVHDALLKAQEAVSRKRVIRLMKQLQLRAKTKRKFKVTTDSNHPLPIAPNLLERNFSPALPNRVWVSDITYLRCEQGWMYLAVVIDLYSRRVVGWALRDRMSASLVCDAFDTACRNRKPSPGMMFHSDRGSQYASQKLKLRLTRHGAIASMSRKGNCWDNAGSESFFATLKKELIRGETFASKDAVERSIFEYIEVFYNRKRKHSFSSGLSPAEFEACQSQSRAA
jgi:putative transposase